jgi:hypothetical protein
MAPAEMKKRCWETPPNAVAEMEELRAQLSLNRNQQVTELQARVAELEAALHAVQQVGRRGKGAAEEVDD